VLMCECSVRDARTHTNGNGLFGNVSNDDRQSAKIKNH